MSLKGGSKQILPVVRCLLVHNEEEVGINILYDTGCTLALCRSALIHQMGGLDGKKCEISINLAGGGEMYSTALECTFKLRSLDRSFTSDPITAVTTKTCIDPVEKVLLHPEDYSHLKSLSFSFSYPQTHDTRIDLILDQSNCLNMTSGKIISKGQGGPCVIKSQLGNILCGSYDPPLPPSPNSRPFLASAASIPNVRIVRRGHAASMTSTLTKFWALESMGISSEAEGALTEDEILAEKMMEEVTTYDRKRKQYVTELLFKMSPSVLESNFDRARATALSAHRRYAKLGEKALEQVYSAYLEKLDLGYSERIEGREREKREGVYFMPTSCVFKNSTSFAVRAIFNASSKSKSGYSLNDVLHSGPDLSCNLFHLLVRYRLSYLYTTADIGRFYWRVELRKGSNSSDYLRYVFVDKTGELQHCRSLSVAFGVTSSSFQAMWCTRHLSKEYAPTYPKAAPVVQSSQYIDDIGYGSKDVADAAETAAQLRNLLLQGNFDSHKWRSSDPTVLSQAKIPLEKQVADDESSFLGLVWNHKTDTIHFDFRTTITRVKKHSVRSLLSIGSKLFDPLGYFSSLTIRLRRLMRRCVEEKLSWDEALSPSILKDWLAYCEEIRSMKPFSVPRPAIGPNEEYFIAAFSDASKDAYASCVYAISPSRVTLVLAKAKICPLKGKNAANLSLTIPRLELLSVYLSTKLTDLVKDAIGRQDIECHYFTDSSISRARILRGPSPYKVWVAARVRHILTRTSPEFVHGLCGLQNPADAPSRGRTMEEVRTDGRWWGEQLHFLRLPRSKWPEHRSFTPEQVRKNEELDKLELQKMEITPAVAAAIQCRDSPFFSLTERLSQFSRIMRVGAFCFRFLLMKCKKLTTLPIFRHAKVEHGDLKINELRVSARFFQRLAQRRTYAGQLTYVEGKLTVESNSDLQRLGGFLDENNVIRAKTRLALSESIPFQTRCPIILPRPSKNSLSLKIVQYVHQQNGHPGLNTTLYLVRRSFMLIGSLKECAFAIHRCPNRGCLKLIRPSVDISPYPDVRTNVDFVPWFSWGIDYLGPLKLLPTPTQLADSCYGVLFCCQTTRCVHVEVVTELTTETFLLTFRKVAALKGMPRYCQTDNAKTFSSADRQLTRLYRKFNQKTIEEETKSKGVVWSFSISRSAASNGSVESMVKIFKNALFKIFRATSRTTLATMDSLFLEACAIANSRPLCRPTSLDAIPVSPALLCQNRELGALPFDAENVNRECKFSRMELYRKQLINSFWKTWRRDVVLRQRVSNFQKDTNYVKVGQIVVLADANVPKGVYKLARITQLFPSKDGKIRRCNLVTPQNTAISRHVNDLYVFEEDIIQLQKERK